MGRNIEIISTLQRDMQQAQETLSEHRVAMDRIIRDVQDLAADLGDLNRRTRMLTIIVRVNREGVDLENLATREGMAAFLDNTSVDNILTVNVMHGDRRVRTQEEGREPQHHPRISIAVETPTLPAYQNIWAIASRLRLRPPQDQSWTERRRRAAMYTLTPQLRNMRYGTGVSNDGNLLLVYWVHQGAIWMARIRGPLGPQDIQQFMDGTWDQGPAGFSPTNHPAIYTRYQGTWEHPRGVGITPEEDRQGPRQSRNTDHAGRGNQAGGRGDRGGRNPTEWGNPPNRGGRGWGGRGPGGGRGNG